MRKADGDRQLLGKLTEAVISDPTQGARATKVWSLTQYSFVRLFICLSGRSMTPHWGGYFSHPFLPATPLSLSRTLEGLFDLTRRPSRALDSPRALLPELQRYKDTVRCGALGAEVPGHCQQQLTQTLIVRL